MTRTLKAGDIDLETPSGIVMAQTRTPWTRPTS
jgi:hypothetical protein